MGKEQEEGKMDQTIEMPIIKGMPKENLVDCLLSYKKETMLTIAEQHAIPAKKSHTKIKLAKTLAAQLPEQFVKHYQALETVERDVLSAYANGKPVNETAIDSADQKKLVESGYLFLFLDQGQFHPTVPQELAVKLTENVSEIPVSDENQANWFAATKRAVETIYGHCSLDHLLTAWNTHATQTVIIETIKE